MLNFLGSFITLFNYTVKYKTYGQSFNDTFFLFSVFLRKFLKYKGYRNKPYSLYTILFKIFALPFHL